MWFLPSCWALFYIKRCSISSEDIPDLLSKPFGRFYWPVMSDKYISGISWSQVSEILQTLWRPGQEKPYIFVQKLHSGGQGGSQRLSQECFHQAAERWLVSSYRELVYNKQPSVGFYPGAKGRFIPSCPGLVYNNPPSVGQSSSPLSASPWPSVSPSSSLFWVSRASRTSVLSPCLESNNPTGAISMSLNYSNFSSNSESCSCSDTTEVEASCRGLPSSAARRCSSSRGLPLAAAAAASSDGS